MRIRILGCGGAAGVPAIAAGWGACDPGEPRNRRLRPSILIEEDGEGGAPPHRLLVDASPDLRQQLLGAGVRALDGVVITHAHADHTHGIDDLREINRAMGRSLDLWATAEVLGDLCQRFDYCFTALAAEATSIYKPMIVPREITTPSFTIGAFPLRTFPQSHGWGETLGLRIGAFAYSTDVVALDEAAFAALAGIDTWIVDCFALQPHPTHAHLDKTLAWIERLKPRQAILTHMGPGLDYRATLDRLPPGVVPAHDGMIIEVHEPSV
ncbi:MBL fold metallo-hydrolase [Rhodospirillum rubrum]|uniref:Beta-lactamase-like n=1 Tax=Rhodospirillum rubrum (strain ATCC 11170 / ATH 1.1.1 / DSM 467 / LMG 4362 / NCIMB 8255 / S1) TaxID=269796 RepID=Q2RTP6_RHORT|nr:MBL fold metallo-hydrolase [Rhodospirillum rubrum]ABC22499.1 Beta-lactamase-like [Rhodospirillum rubrum ATCC 11170]AEO48217.1 beta-lactamase-like protein [Rhodospirillum rubrum F11]MBK5954087.1 MBL fold metallo-hydrolase [Rhodospirillum rubrum]QXG82129.1 MBL fold metallo-hydrolase [Rhodospirillum rubrum]HAQ00994.1 MBL fold metallo-hydrolase [Rhodospirillum rubrum]